MPHWDLQCEQCGRVYDMRFDSVEHRDGMLKHLLCNAPCKGRLIVCPNVSAFNVKGFNAANGYSGRQS